MLLQSCLVLHKATYLSALSCLCTDGLSPDNDNRGQFSTFQPSAQLIGNTAVGLGRRNRSSRREDLSKAAASVALAAEAWTKMRGTGRRVGPSRKVLPGVSLSSLSHSAWMAIKELWWRQILLSRGRRAGERASSSLQVVQEFRKWSAVRSAGLNTPAQHRSQWKNTFRREEGRLAFQPLPRLVSCIVCCFFTEGEKRSASFPSLFVPALSSPRRTH